MLKTWQLSEQPPELGPDDDYNQDPIAAFGILEARKHRARGVSLRMFLGLMKYYRQSYHDLVCQAGFGKISGEHCRFFIDRFFDRVEIGFCMEWAGLSNEARDAELQAANRAMTNERNKYLTIFESLPTPMFFLGPDNRVSNLNQVAAELFRGLQVPGEVYHGAECPPPVETRDPYTSGHQRGVAGLAATLAQEMKFTPEAVEGMRVTGFLHDIGKIAVPAEILSKPGKIGSMEFNLIKCHSQVGHDILQAIEFPWPAAQAVLQHHERLDVSGYPLGIKDGDIIPEARSLKK